ncbi:cytochrome-c peroxidase [Sphingobacterium sp. B16(2022)]|uniref:cytochrome-c peroxidase n=1 Tax=Sphingobacterium sp. B16(2022) TaxID=2914044 RepID=UPI001F295E02|nr:cytochrome c peroxidase [Sphingobacterium sp. B16(2022)]
MMIGKGLKVGVFTSIVLSLCTISCGKVQVDTPLPDQTPTPLMLKVPAHFPAPTKMLDNPLTVEGVNLGRHLFYDPLLSANMQVSCASCHHQERAFADGVALTAAGVSGKTLERHSPTLINLAWTDQGFFWDGGATNLESQAFGPLTHADEMGMSLVTLANRLIASEFYVNLFQQAFAEKPSAQGAAKALAQFQRTLISSNSRYDNYRSGQDLKALSAGELRGMHLVKQKCGTCHSGELFTDNAFHNNGIDDDFTDDSNEWIHRGRYRISFNPIDLGAFKTPTLRNVTRSAPYMHDGRFKSLDQVLQHYRSGIKHSPVTDRLLYDQNENPGIAMSDKEMTEIKSFLEALTDDIFLNETNFSNPNKK